MSAREEVHWRGIHYDDIDWSKPIHDLGPVCPCCGYTADDVLMGGHNPSCYYNWRMMESPRGHSFLRDMIEEAVKREEKENGGKFKRTGNPKHR